MATKSTSGTKTKSSKRKTVSSTKKASVPRSTKKTEATSNASPTCCISTPISRWFHKYRAIIVPSVIVIICVLLIAPFMKYSSPEKKPTDLSLKLLPPDTQARLESVLETYSTANKLPGIGVGIWYGNAAPWVSSRGFSNLKTKQSFDPNKEFRIGNITKTFVATVVLQLVDEGKLSLEDQVSVYVPYLVNGDHVTVQELLIQTSGIPDYTNDSWFRNIAKAFPMKNWQTERLIASSNKHVPDSLPGKIWTYSNTNYILLGLIVESVTKNKLENEIRTRIVDKLGLTNTYFPTSYTFAGPYTHGYWDDDEHDMKDVSLMNPSWVWAAGEMISTMADLSVYANALANGTLLSPTMQKKRLTSWTAASIPSADGAEYGLGWIRYKGFVGHHGGLSGYSSLMFHHPEKSITIVVLINLTTGKNLVYPVMDQVLDTINEM